MKTTFTLLIVIGLSIHAFAQRSNPFNKKVEKQSPIELNQLKNGHLNFLPASITFDDWEAESWKFVENVSFEYDEHGNVLVMTTAESRTTNTYDESNRMTQSIVEAYDTDAGIYVNSAKTDYSYEDNQNSSLVEIIIYAYVGDIWFMTGGSRVLTEYDMYGLQSVYLYSIYTPGTVGWKEISGEKIERTYAGELLTEDIWYYRQNGAWVPDDKTEYFYDSNEMVNLAREYDHNGTDFVLEGRYTDASWYVWSGNVDEGSYALGYTYQTYNGTGDINDDANYTNDEKLMATYPEGQVNGTPLLAIEVYHKWMDETWIESERETYEQKDNFVSELDEEWRDGQWEPVYYEKTYTTPSLVYYIEHSYESGNLVKAEKDTQVFDAHGNVIEDKDEWHGGDENWMQDDGSMFVISYEGSTAKMLQRITKEWNQSTGMYVNDMRETFDYAPTNINTEMEGASVYPTIIDKDINIVSTQDGIATFYSLTGSVVFQKQVYSGTNNVSTSALPAGYYILKINSDIFKVIKK